MPGMDDARAWKNNLNTNLTWKHFKNISGGATEFADLPGNYSELQLSIVYKSDSGQRIMWLARTIHDALPADMAEMYQCKVGHYATAADNAMVNIYLTKNKIKVAQAYVNGSDVHSNIVVGIYYR